MTPQWRDVGPAKVYIAWDEAKIIQGVYGGSKEVTTGYGLSTVHTIERRDGKHITFFGPRS